MGYVFLIIIVASIITIIFKMKNGKTPDNMYTPYDDAINGKK